VRANSPVAGSAARVAPLDPSGDPGLLDRAIQADAARGRPAINPLGLYAACYVVLLGTTYLVLPTSELVSRPSFLELRGLAYTVLGLVLLWASIDALGAGLQRAAYLLAGAVVLATAVDFGLAGRYGTAASHGLLGAALLYTAAALRRSTELRLLGLVLGGGQVCAGANMLLQGSVGGSVFGVPAAAIGALHVLTGAAVVAANVGTRREAWRIAAHAIAGSVMFVHLVGTLWPQPVAALTIAATWFRATVLLLLPVWEQRVARLNVRTLRARAAAAFATIALVAGVAPLALVAWHGESDDRFTGLGAWPYVAYWSILLATVACGWIGAAWIGPRLARALRTALDPAERATATPGAGLHELDEVVALSREHARKVSSLETALTLRSDHTGGIGHDLRTPLSAIANVGTLLQRAPLEAERQRRLGEIVQRSVAQMRSLVENLVHAARLDTDAAGAPPAPERIELAEFLADVEAEFESRLERHRLEFRAAAATVTFDRQALQRIVTNLVENALKFAPDASPVHVRVEPQDASVAIAVADHGPGVPEPERSRVFERYYRAGRTSAPGFGLGLYICRQLATANGARLEVGETPGGGATFRLVMPR
jgi:signal transduction histidine kinase